jgi:PAS domain S-box-containing protein
MDANQAASAMKDAERDLSSEARHERDALLAAAFAEAPIGLVFTTPDGKVLDANPTYFNMIGYTREELASRDSAHFTHPDDILPTRQFFASLQNPSHPAAIFEKRYIHKDGHTVWARVSATMRHDGAGRPTQLVAIVEDVTERKRDEAALAEKARLAALGADVGAALTRIAALPDSLQQCAEAIVKNLGAALARIWTLEPGEDTLQLQASAGLYTHLNGAYSRIPVGALKIGQIAQERRPLVSNDVANDPRVSDREWVKREGITAFAGHPLIVDDRVIGVIALFARCPLDEDVLSALASVADSIAVGIKRKRAEEALRHQWQVFDTALSYTPDFTYTFGLDGRFTYINRALLSLWQKPLSEAVGKNFFDLEYPPDLAARLHRQIQTVIDTKEPLRDHTPYTGANGAEGFYEYIFVPVFDDNGQVTAVAGSTRDITEHVRMQEALSASEQKLQQVFSQAPVAILVLRGRDFVVELANDSYRSLLQGRELVGRRFADVVPELGQDVWDVINRVMDTGEPFVATEFPAPYDSDGDGITEDHWFNLVYHPLREPDGAISGFIGILTDVSVQVRARQQLERANRELEEFAYVASHDLQEPLRMVNIYTDLLIRRYVGDQPEAAKYAAFVSQGVHRMETLIRDLLTFSRTVHMEPGECGEADLSEALAEAVAVLKDRISETGAILTWDRLPVARGDPSQLAHVFQNVLSNALKYRKQDVPPRVQIAAERHGQECVIAVRDNGIGFDPQYAERIFGLFKRLHKDEYPGTGLGLAICQRIVERYGGRMWAESAIGEGSTFYLSLPCSEIP